MERELFAYIRLQVNTSQRVCVRIQLVKSGEYSLLVMLLLLSLLEGQGPPHPPKMPKPKPGNPKAKSGIWLNFQTNLQVEKRFSRIVADTAKTFEQKSRDIHAFIQQYGNRR